MTSTGTDLEVRDKQALEREGTRPGPIFRPDVDILERSDAYVVYADLPGVDESSIDVRLDRGTLTLDAWLATRPEADWNPLHIEYRDGGYHRDFQLSDEIDRDAVTAVVRNGVLELVLPKTAAHQPRSIPVQVG